VHGGDNAKFGDPYCLPAAAASRKEETHACAPSDNAMKGSNDQSFSTAGFDPSSAKHNSISGPLLALQNRQQFIALFFQLNLWGRHGVTRKREKKQTWHDGNL
jgi:hypothetical protein